MPEPSDVATVEPDRRGAPPETRSLSVIVTAMNEAGNLAPTVANVLAAASPRFADFEIIIIDDGSTDGTSALADRLAAGHPRIAVHHNDGNRGLAYSYRKGIALSSKRFTGWVAGNNIVPRQGLEDLYDRVGQADVVMSYILTDVRGLPRRSLSRMFTLTLNTLFGVRLRYHTGPCVYRTEALQRVRTTAGGSMIVPELLLRMIAEGQSFIQVPLQPQPRTGGKTKTFRVRNVVLVVASVARLFWEIRLLGLTRPRRTRAREVAPCERDPTVGLES